MISLVKKAIIIQKLILKININQLLNVTATYAFFFSIKIMKNVPAPAANKVSPIPPTTSKIGSVASAGAADDWPAVTTAAALVVAKV